MSPPIPLRLGVALDGAGFHPAAWRSADARPADLLSPRYWADLATVADEAGLDFLTIEDAFGLQGQTLDGPERQRLALGRLDAVLTASYLGRRTRHIGLVPTASTTHAEPFHIASTIATLDYVSEGRGGWRPQVSGRPEEAAHLGLRSLPGIDLRRFDEPDVQAVVRELFDEASDAVEVVRRLWDSWEDDAIIRDVPTGRFIDRHKLHYIDFEGRHFSVKGPSIVPRPPQGQPLVVALAHTTVPFRFAAGSADVVLVTPSGPDDAPRWIADVRAAEAEVGRDGEPLRILADLVVLVDATQAGAAARKAQLDQWAGSPLRSDAEIVVGTPDELVDHLVAYADAGIEGFRLRPAVLPTDLAAIAGPVVDGLRRAGRFQPAAEGGSLRSRFGLPRPANRYATAAPQPA